MAWTDTELAELAMCARLGAVQARKDAESADAVSVKHVHIKTAELREQLAERLEAARLRHGQSASTQSGTQGPPSQDSPWTTARSRPRE